MTNVKKEKATKYITIGRVYYMKNTLRKFCDEQKFYIYQVL